MFYATLICMAGTLIVDKENALYIVDWDTLIFAPVERDLMFIGAGIWDSGLTA
jgi:spectinomycin phosphotransferase